MAVATMNKLKECRKAAGLTQWDLAKLMNVSQTKIWQWERSYIPISAKTKTHIAEILKADVLTIFPNQEGGAE